MRSNFSAMPSRIVKHRLMGQPDTADAESSTYAVSDTEPSYSLKAVCWMGRIE